MMENVKVDEKTERGKIIYIKEIIYNLKLISIVPFLIHSFNLSLSFGGNSQWILNILSWHTHKHQPSELKRSLQLFLNINRTPRRWILGRTPTGSYFKCWSQAFQLGSEGVILQMIPSYYRWVQIYMAMVNLKSLNTLPGLYRTAEHLNSIDTERGREKINQSITQIVIQFFTGGFRSEVCF